MSEPQAVEMLPVEAGHVLPVRKWRPAGSFSQAIVALHGTVSHSGWFDGMGHALARRGVALFASDRRGSGLARELPGLGDPNLWIQDAVDLVSRARQEAEQVTLFAWSAGARTALAGIGAGKIKADRLILAAPMLAFSEYLEKGVAKLATQRLVEYPLPFDPIGDMSPNPAIQAFIKNDPLWWRTLPLAFIVPEQGIFNQALAAIETLKTPMLCLLAEGDGLLNNDKIAELLVRFDVRRLPGAHALILEEPDAIADTIVKWLSKPTP